MIYVQSVCAFCTHLSGKNQINEHLKEELLICHWSNKPIFWFSPLDMELSVNWPVTENKFDTPILDTWAIKDAVRKSIQWEFVWYNRCLNLAYYHVQAYKDMESSVGTRLVESMTTLTHIRHLTRYGHCAAD